jgi:hypothetical protein
MQVKIKKVKIQGLEMIEAVVFDIESGIELFSIVRYSVQGVKAELLRLLNNK